MPDVLLHLRLRVDSKSKCEAARAKVAAVELQYASIRSLLSASLSDEDEESRKGCIYALLDKSRSGGKSSPTEIVGAIRMLNAIYERFVDTFMDSRTIELTEEDEAVRSLLANNKDGMVRALLATALARYPDDCDLKQLSTGFTTSDLAKPDSSSTAAAMLKEMVLRI